MKGEQGSESWQADIWREAPMQKVAVLEEGMKYTSDFISPEQAIVLGDKAVPD